MNIYRSKANRQLYLVSRLIINTHGLDRSAEAGIHAEPYRHGGEKMFYPSKDEKVCERILERNFILVSTI